MGNTGITKLSYNNTVLFNTATDPAGGFTVLGYNTTTNGVTTYGNLTLNPYTSNWNAQKQILSYVYSWGSVAVQYTVAASTIGMNISVVNTTSNTTVDGLDFYALNLHFPTMPAGFNSGPQASFGDLGPDVTVADFGTGAAAVVDNDPGKSLYSGFMPYTNTPTTNEYILWLGSTALGWQPPSWPVFNQPVAPGASDTYHFQLRFGPTGSTAATLAPDIIGAYTAAHPDTVDWPNRQPIGMLWPAGSAPSVYTAINPRGWLNDPTINVTTPAGLADFSQKLLAYAASSIAILKAEGAQGMITWDIEGEQYPAADYVGDPRLATTLAPELAYDNTVGQYFAAFRNAGLEVGVTIRDDQFVWNNGNPYEQAISNAQADAQMLISKIDYAMQNWGCTLFYIDSNNWQDDPSIMEEVHQQCPGVLLIPEQSYTGVFSSVAPYADTRNGSMGTPESVTMVYPGAFEVINAVNTDMVAQNGILVNDVEQGDILLFAGWFNAPTNAIVSSIYQQAAAAKAALTAPVTPVPPSPEPVVATAAQTLATSSQPLVPAAQPAAKVSSPPPVVPATTYSADGVSAPSGALSTSAAVLGLDVSALSSSDLVA
jgi:hypothetical protein